MQALKAQGISRDTLPYKAPFQPWGSWFALVVTGIITLFKGFDTFLPFTTDTFITCVGLIHVTRNPVLINVCRSYIAVPTFFVLWLGYKLIYKTTVIPSEDVDLVSGLQQINDEEEKYLMNEKAKGPQTRLQRIWDSL